MQTLSLSEVSDCLKINQFHINKYIHLITGQTVMIAEDNTLMMDYRITKGVFLNLMILLGNKGFEIDFKSAMEDFQNQIKYKNNNNENNRNNKNNNNYGYGRK